MLIGNLALLIVDPRPTHEVLDPDIRHVREVGSLKVEENPAPKFPFYPSLSDIFDLSEKPLDGEPSNVNLGMNSLFDIITSYYERTNAGINAHPIDSTYILRKIVIAKWIAYLNFVKLCHAFTAMELSASPNTSQGYLRFNAVWAPTWKEGLFQQLLQWKSNLVGYQSTVEHNMQVLGIDPDDNNSHGSVDQKEAGEWRYIQKKLREYRDSFESTANSYTQVMGLRVSQTSNSQARSAGHLTVLATLFVPISIISGILSMGGQFLPGESRFWVFFAVVVPILLIISLCIFTNIIPWALRREDHIFIRRQKNEKPLPTGKVS